MKTFSQKTEIGIAQSERLENARESNAERTSFFDCRQEAAVHEDAKQMADNSPYAAGVAQLKAGIENLSGYTMDDVRVHYNAPEPAQLNAHAYAKAQISIL